MGNTCEGCAKKQSLLQRTVANDNAASVVETVSSEAARWANNPLEAATHAQSEPRIGHDFSRVRAHPETPVQHRDDSDGEEATESGKRDHTQLPGAETQAAPPTATEIAPAHEAVPTHTKGSGATTTTCPTKATIETVTNKAADGVKYRTGMGAVTTIKVDPDTQNSDGTNIVESFPKGITSNCPKEFGISPCNGSSTFIVGASRTSPVFGALAATKNRFYDFHETRWKGGSLLHDRNPAGIDSCTISCEQNYSCGGTVIGKPTITRTFSKGKVGIVDVTNVNVAKA